ncbi:MAG: hypothetical protein Kow00120_24840 [Anaerolineae bacterium]
MIAMAALLGSALPAAAQEQDDAWLGQYYNNRHLNGFPVFTRLDPEIAFDFGGGGPGPGIGDDNFSVRWTRRVYFPTSGTYEFGARTDDGVRVWVDGALIIDEWEPRQGQWALGQIFLNAGVHSLRVLYYEAEGGAQAHLGWRLAAQESAWLADFYANTDLSGNPVLSREDDRIAFDWGTGSPDPAVPADRFSARWRRSAFFYAGVYRFHAVSDDGVRVYIDGNPIIDAWTPQDRVPRDTVITLNEDRVYRLTVEYFEQGGGASIDVWWEALQITGGQPTGGQPAGGTTGGPWLGEYFGNRDLIGPPVLARNDAAIDFNWSDGPPHPAMARDNFSVRWTRTVPLSRGTWRFHADVDDGVRIWANDHSLIYQWIETDNGIYQADLSLTEGGTFVITVEYFEGTGFARVKVWYEKIDDQPR